MLPTAIEGRLADADRWCRTFNERVRGMAVVPKRWACVVVTEWPAVAEENVMHAGLLEAVGRRWEG